jgi:FkbM family methyltransferase
MIGINWSAIRRETLMGRFLRLPLGLVPADAIMTVRRGPARGMRWIAGACTHGCWLGTYEQDKQRAIGRFVRPGDIVFDIGAQAGFFSLLLARLVGETGTVIAFEPSPTQCSMLLRHVALNHLENVRVVQAAVSDRPGLACFTVDRGVTMNALADAQPAGPLTVATVALDAVDLPAPALMKIDVEGAESRVLAGARDLIRRRRPIVFVALHNDEQKRRCLGQLRDSGYGIFDLSGNRVGDFPATDEVYALPE